MSKKIVWLLLLLIISSMLIAGCFGKKIKLDISIVGNGMVKKNPDDLGKGYKSGLLVRLEAIPADGWFFKDWEGDLKSANTVLEIKTDKNYQLKANFALLEAPKEMTITVQTNAITLTWLAVNDIAGYNIARSLSETSEKVILNTEPLQETVYVDVPLSHVNDYYYWLSSVDKTGQSSNWAGPYKAKKKNALTINIVGKGMVVKNPDDNGTGYDYDQSVELVAQPHEDYRFVGWQLDASGTSPVTVSMDQNRAVTAVFEEVIKRVPEQYATIQAAITAATPGNKIIVSPGIYLEKLDLLGKKDLIISSTNPLDPTVVAQTIIDGNGQNGFCITAKNNEENVVIQGFKIANFASILTLVNTTNFTLDHCDISDNNNLSFNGFIHGNNAQNFLITNTTFMKNYLECGGLMYFDTQSTVTLNESTIISNKAKYTGLIVASGGSKMTLVSNSISTNTTENGSILNATSNSTLTLNNNILSDNMGQHYGAISVNNSSATLQSNSFSRNISFISLGAGLYAYNSVVTLTENDFINNKAAHSGGAICAEGNSNLLIHNNNFVNNSAGSFGGAICANNETNLTIINNNITGNKATSSYANCTMGGAIYSSGSAVLALQSNTISNNVALGGSAYGGAISVSDSSQVLLLDNIISDNESCVNGTNSSSYSFGGAISVIGNARIAIQYNTIKNNKATALNPRGGGIYQYTTALITNPLGEILTTEAQIEAASTFIDNVPDNLFHGNL